MQIDPYLNFDGRCAEAFRFYAELLGGDLEIITHGDSPIADEVPESMQDAVLHARLVVGDQVLMASDAPPDRYQAPAGVYVSLSVDELEDGRRIFDALAEGGRVDMPFEATFWSPGFGMLVDRWGTPWMVNCLVPAGEEAGVEREQARSL